MRIHKTCLTLAILAALAAEPVLAETPAADAPQAAPTSNAPAPSPKETAALGEVTVTAQRREENVQKIPVAVAVVGAEQIERANATDISNLTSLIPSVTFSAGNELRNNSIRIRGVGTDVFSTGVESSVSTVVDGVVLQRPGAAFSDLNDIDRVEVLRGPQGTLFGKNSSAGVVNVVTHGPDFDYMQGNFSAGVAENAQYRVNGAIGGPINSDWAYRISGFYRTQDGTVTNQYNGDTVNDQKSYGFRGKLGWGNADAPLQVTFAADYAKMNATCCALPIASWSGASALTKPVWLTVPTGRDNDNVDNDVNPYVHQKNWGGSITADLHLGDYTLSSISAYRHFSNISNVDLDDTPAQFITQNYNIETSKTKTQELRLLSPTGGPIDYVLGAYYFNGSAYNFLDRRGLNAGAVQSINADGSIVPVIPGDQAILTGNSLVRTWNQSVYGQGNLHAGDKLTFTLGLRYLDEDQKLKFIRPVDGKFNGVNKPATNPAFGPVEGHYSDNATIGKVAVNYAFTPKITGYVSYSTGYKSEGIAATLGLSAAQFKNEPAPAETSELIEAGLKTLWFDNHLLFNVTGFHTRFQNYQGQTFNSATGLVVLTSVGGVVIDGAELEFTARPIDNFSISGGATFLNAHFDNAPNGPCYTGQTVALGCAPAGPGLPNVQNLNGKPFVNAPDQRYTLSARYELPLVGGKYAYVQGDYRWQSGIIFDLSQNPNLAQGSYGVADFSAGLLFGEGKYDVSFYVKNLLDKQYAAGMMAVSGAGGATAYAQQLSQDFRRYAGVTFRAHF